MGWISLRPQQPWDNCRRIEGVSPGVWARSVTKWQNLPSLGFARVLRAQSFDANR
jgi:hypothetical protein